MSTPSAADRNARLDQLSSAVVAWADKRKTDLNNQVAFSKRVLQGRTGSQRLASATVANATDLVVNEVNAFLTGQ